MMPFYQRNVVNACVDDAFLEGYEEYEFADKGATLAM